MSAMSTCRVELKGCFMELRRQSGEHPAVGPMAGIGRSFHENRGRVRARCSHSRPAAIWKTNLGERSIHPSDIRSLECVITSQKKVALNPARGDKLREQRSRKLDRRSSGTPDNDLPNRPSVVVQVLLFRNVESKFKLLHVLAPKRWE
jgi:hypothetical protein